MTTPGSCTPCWTPAPGRIRVGTVMADRGFFSRVVMNVLNDSGVAWIIPCPNTVYARTLADFEACRRQRVSDAVITPSSSSSSDR